MTEYLLFAQHGWADTGNNIGRLANAAAASTTKVIAPSLGLIKTFIRLKPLVEQLEKIAAAEIANYPQASLKILGHSMGGLMWLELLNRNPDWWQRIHSLILLGSPVGGSNIARIIDPLGIGIGTAADLGKNRRPLAEKIARSIPTLSVASDLGMGTDGLVTVENTKFDYANWQLIPGIAHSAMRYREEMIPIIQAFWANPRLGLSPETSLSHRLIQHLRAVPGMTDTDYRGLERSQIVTRLSDNLDLRIWHNPFRVNHVYLCQQRRCLYAGYVGLLHAAQFQKAIKTISNISI
ncbi:MAG: lysophospholipase [Cyanobacteria bacterium P01_C01_bin.72]